MVINRFISFLFLGFLLLSLNSMAEGTDFRLRMAAEVETELTNDLSAGLEYEQRFDQFLTTFDKALLQPSVSYDLNKHWKLGFLYRITLDQNARRERQFEHRISGSLRYDFKLDDFEIKLKTILQYGSDDLTNSLFSSQQKILSRNSFELEYKWFGKPYTPFIKYELFTHLNNPGGAITKQSRLSVGAAYKLSK
ncbi:MAG: DUF2490 domain-containing protein, partial [Prolixibacteraceae bacterium]|nr:DUF2490 domain-containing protein [Prolixibacteraceae bacterium]